MDQDGFLVNSDGKYLVGNAANVTSRQQTQYTWSKQDQVRITDSPAGDFRTFHYFSLMKWKSDECSWC